MTPRPPEAREDLAIWKYMKRRARGRRTETNERDEKTDTRADGHDERLGHDAGEPLPEAKKGEDQEDPALHEDGSEGLPIRDEAGAVESNNRVRELSDARIAHGACVCEQ